MKRYINYIMTAALVCAGAFTANAQGLDNNAVSSSKKVSSNGDGTYTLTLETYLTGAKITSTEITPTDVILVVDYSWSMANNNVSGQSKTRVPVGTTLTLGTEYAVEVNGTEYRMKGYEGTAADATYKARASQAYTYNGYGSNVYYYKHTDGKYYPVTRTTYTSGYSPLSSADYSYNSYGTNKYYYYHDGKYSLVTRDTYTTDYYYKARSSESYTYSSYGSNEYYYKDGNEYYKVSRSTGEGYEYSAKIHAGEWSPSDVGYLSNSPNVYYRYSDGNYYMAGRDSFSQIEYVKTGGSTWTYNEIAADTFYFYYDVENKYFLVQLGYMSTSSLGKPRDVYAYIVTDSHGTLYLRDDGRLNGTKKALCSLPTSIMISGTYLYRHKSVEYQCIAFVKDGVKYYLQADGSASTTPYGHESALTNICDVTLYSRSTVTTYFLSYVKGGTTYYLNGSSSSTSKNGASGTRSTIYTGVLYEYTQDGCYCLKYTDGGTTYYLKPDGGVTTQQSQTGNNTSNTATLYSGVLYKEAEYYALTYTVGGTTYYLTQGGSSTTAQTGVSSNTATVFNGVLYEPDNKIYSYRYDTTAPSNISSGNEYYTGKTNYVVKDGDKIYTLSSSTRTRLEVAKSAVSQFIQTVYENTPADGYHKIGVIGFNSSAFTVVDFAEVTASSKTTMINTVNNYNNTEMSTQPDKGIDMAAEVFEEIKDDGRPKIMVFFTDGFPGTNNAFDATYATKAVNSSYTVKHNYATTVYSVACLSQSDMSNQQMENFLHFVSSNYPEKQNPSSYTELSGTAAAPHDYMIMSDGSNLTEIFDEIAHETTTGGAAISTLDETSLVLDVITESFQLPAGANTSSIKLYTSRANLSSDGSVTSWATKVAAPNAIAPDVEVVKAAANADGTTDIIVRGFDFATYWVGLGATDPYKLILEIPIVPKNDAVGGEDIETNAGNSGVYLPDPDNPDEPGEAIEEYEIPTIDLPVKIQITKTGMQPGESATFVITRRPTSSADIPANYSAFTTVILTGPADTTQPAIAVLKELDPHYIYKITEGNWSWTYVTENVGGQSLTTQGVFLNPFEFSNAKKNTDIPQNNAEAVAHNVFEN